MDNNRALAELRQALGYKRLTRSWAKIEILLGLLAAGVGLFLGEWTFHERAEPPWLTAGRELVLFVLGAYLALAGHRSHLYQSNNELTAYLAEQIRSSSQAPR